MAKRPGASSSKLVTVPAPVGGWNARDPLSAMAPNDAVRLDNFIAGPQGVILRNGYIEHVTGIGDPVETLMEHSAPAGTNTLLAAAGDSIYDVTTAGAVGAAEVASLGNARFQHTMFATSGGNYLVMCNGQDAVRNFDGSLWTSPTITNVTSANLIGVMAHVSRLWFIEEDTLSVWYLPTAAIAGAAVELDLGSLCRLGGSLLAMASWTRDGGSGPDDLAVFVTNKGEVLIYSGTDPSSANTWSLVGVFRIPEPVGRRCLLKIGADLAIITAQGVLPLSSVLPYSGTGTERIAVTNKINDAFLSANISNGTTFGWQIIEYMKGALLVVNVPTGTGTTSDQFVMNTLTGGWSRFTGIDALCWSQSGDNIYFGTNDGNVYRYGVDYSDLDEPITGAILTAFSNFNYSGFKRFVMARPLFSAAEGSDPPIELRTDYDTSTESLSFSSIPSGGTKWDEGTWDVAEWGPAVVPINSAKSLAGIGLVGAFLIGVSSTTPVTLNHIDVMFEPGGPL